MAGKSDLLFNGIKSSFLLRPLLPLFEEGGHIALHMSVGQYVGQYVDIP